MKKILSLCLIIGLPSIAHADDPTPAMLSAYVGILDSSRVYAAAGCPANPGRTGDGMPVVFNTEIDGSTLDREDFLISFYNDSGALESAVPECVGLTPADEDYENRTVLVVGQFGSGQVTQVAVVDGSDLADEEGHSLATLTAQQITPYGEAETLVYAEVLPIDEWQPGECPASTRLALQVTWNGGVTGPDATIFDEDIQATDYTVTFVSENGHTITRHPGTLGDTDDGDNNHILCLKDQMPRNNQLTRITALAGEFCSPANFCTGSDVSIELPPTKRN